MIRCLGAVDVRLVELADRVVEVLPGLAAVVGDVHAAVVAEQHVLRIVGIDPERVMIDVHPVHLHRRKALAAIVGDAQLHRVDVNALAVVGIDVDLVVEIVGQRGNVVDARPAATRIIAAEDAALRAHRRAGRRARHLNHRIHGTRILRRDAQADAPHRFGRQSVAQCRIRQLAPVASTIRRLPDAAARTRTLHGAAATAQPVPARGIQHVRIGRVHLHIDEGHRVIGEEHLLPVVTTVGRLVDAARGRGPPQVAHGRHIDNVRIARMNRDAADLRVVGQSALLPRLACVGGLVDAIAPAL